MTTANATVNANDRRQLMREFGFESEKEFKDSLDAARLYRLMQKEGFFKESQVRKEYPGFDLAGYEERFGVERVERAEQLLRTLKQTRARTSVHSLRESFGADFFDQLLTDKMNAGLAAEFAEQPILFEPLVAEIEESDFFNNDVIKMGELADVDDLSKTGQIFQEVSAPTESKVSYTIEGRGNIIAVDFKTLTNDRLGWFDTLSERAARAMNRRVNKFFFRDNLEDNPTLDDGNTLFDNTNHANDPNGGATVTLNYANLETIWQSVRKQTYGGNPIDLGANFGFYIITGANNELNAMKLKTSEKNPFTGNNEDNIFRERIIDVISYLDFSSDDFWAVAVPPDVVEGFRFAFLTGYRTPVFEQISENEETKESRWRLESYFGGKWIYWQGICRGSA